MIQAGYLAKRVEDSSDWLGATQVEDIYSVSGCISEDFADYINYWQHNGYWLFDSPKIIRSIAGQHAICLSGCTLFYYELYEFQFNEKNETWESFEPEKSFPLAVESPCSPILEGFDVVSFTSGNNPECSPLSCNGLAAEVVTNRHCLLESLDEARRSLKDGKFAKCEPGPYRIFSVHTQAWP